MTNAEYRTHADSLRTFVIRLSLLLLLLDQIGELIEKIRGIMRAGRGFGMVLHAEDWQLLVAHSLYCAVI